MNIRTLSLAASLALALGGAALAQSSTGPVTQPLAASTASSAVGHWLYDTRGNIIGSVRSLTNEGQTAVIMVGSYFQPGSHLDTVRASSLTMVDGKVMLKNETVQALNTALWWR
jgi:hypothetical protein